jgi:hypothetical protein
LKKANLSLKGKLNKNEFSTGEYFKKHGPLEEYTKRVYTANESVKKYVEGRAKCDY